MIWLQCRCTRAGWSWTDPSMWGWAFSTSRRVSCTISTTTRWRPSMATAWNSLYGYRQPSPRDPDGGRLQRHGRPPKPLRHLWLPGRPPSTQQGQQEGAREDEGWVCRPPYRRIRWPQAEDVQHPRSLRGLHQEGQGREKERCEEAHQARAIQRGSLQ